MSESIHKGLFVTVEGPDGAGKTTQINLLTSFAQKEGWLLTRNPGGTNFGLKLREILLNDLTISVNPIAELLLYMADRAQHVQEVIAPAIQAGKVVICDRFIDSTASYQGYGRGLDLNFIHQLNEKAIQGYKPNLTFLLDLDPEIGLQRAKSRSDVKDKLEAEGLNFQKKVRAGFLELAASEPERFCVIDVANKTAEEVHQIMLNEIRKRLIPTLSFQK